MSQSDRLTTLTWLPSIVGTTSKKSMRAQGLEPWAYGLKVRFLRLQALSLALTQFAGTLFHQQKRRTSSTFRRLSIRLLIASRCLNPPEVPPEVALCRPAEASGSFLESRMRNPAPPRLFARKSIL